MREFDVKRFFSLFSTMSSQERKSFLQALSAYRITDIECYTYPEVPGIKHVFFYFDGKKEAVPYFMLEKELLLQIQELIEEFMSR